MLGKFLGLNPLDTFNHEVSKITKIHIFQSKVLIFCVEFWELSHLTRDLSQAEKKITVVTSLATDKMTSIFTQTTTLTSEIDISLCICSVCNTICFLLSLR